MRAHFAPVLGRIVTLMATPSVAGQQKSPAAGARTKTLPLLRGTLWSMQPEMAEWSDELLSKTVQAQRDEGFVDEGLRTIWAIGSRHVVKRSPAVHPASHSRAERPPRRARSESRSATRM